MSSTSAKHATLSTRPSLASSLDYYGLATFDLSWGGVVRGIEKESLRVSPSGALSQSIHPHALGSTLTNPYITTDFSESLLEFITPAYERIEDCLGMLEGIHRFTLTRLENQEMLWGSSMPCALGGEDEIPIALFGTSNLGRLKTLYREGLSNRYGKIMQTIAGIHYNFSMPESFWPQYQQHCGDTGSLQDFRTNKYLHLIRNFHRYSWLLVYLFGASPAACKSFVRGREHSLQELDANSLYLPYATCLRMGNLGYKSEAQKSLFVCYNDLNNYAECLDTAMHTPYPEYEAIDRGPNGEPRQINANLLQLENEFYSTIRPKRNVKSGQRPLAALKEGGIEYIEVRALDLNPYLPLGIDAEQIRFLDTFLVHCLLAPSPECHQAEFFEVAENLTRVVEQGRDPALMLSEEGKPRAMRQWAATVLDSLSHAATLLDSIHNAADYPNGEYASALQAQVDKLNDAGLTPSGRMLTQMQEEGLSFFQLALTLAQRQHEFLLESRDNAAKTLPSQADEAMFEKVAKQSLADQASLEAESQLDFEEFLAQWNAA